MQEPTLVYQSRFTRNSIFSTSNTEAQSPSHRLSIISAFQPSDPHATSFYPATRIEYEDNRMLKESDAAHRVMNVLLMISLQTVTSLYAASISSASANANLAIACCALHASIIMVNLLRLDTCNRRWILWKLTMVLSFIQCIIRRDLHPKRKSQNPIEQQVIALVPLATCNSRYHNGDQTRGL